VLSAQSRILAIEDDVVLGAHLKTSLEQGGFAVTLAVDGESGLNLARRNPFDLILLDVMLPGLSGLEVLSRLRQERSTPVLMMSAQGDEGHRINGFDRGADDYLPKPFGIRELQVRVAAILRRVAYERNHAGAQPRVDGLLEMNERNCRARYGEIWLSFTPTEFRLLQILFDNLGEVQSKAFLYQHVLHRGIARHDRVLDMHASNLRRKLVEAGVQRLKLESVWGQGYLLSEQAN